MRRPIARPSISAPGITLEDEHGQEKRYRIVGPDETDAARGWISIDSPLARAVLKKRVDDEFAAELPDARASFVVVDIRYGEEIATRSGGG